MNNFDKFKTFQECKSNLQACNFVLDLRPPYIHHDNALTKDTSSLRVKFINSRAMGMSGTATCPIPYTWYPSLYQVGS